MPRAGTEAPPVSIDDQHVVGYKATAFGAE